MNVRTSLHAPLLKDGVNPKIGSEPQSNRKKNIKENDFLIFDFIVKNIKENKI